MIHISAAYGAIHLCINSIVLWYLNKNRHDRDNSRGGGKVDSAAVRPGWAAEQAGGIWSVSAFKGIKWRKS